MKAYIKGISYFLPEKVLTNNDLIEAFPEWTVEKVNAKIGIGQRHITSEGETASDMAVKAAEKLFEEYGFSRDSIDFVLFCTQSPDYFIPTTACLIQSRLGLSTACGALDFNLGCSGFVYGLSLAKGLIFSGTAKNVLLLTAETYSKYCHEQDKGNRSIFGDAGAATLISSDGIAEIGNFSLGTNGQPVDTFGVKTGGSRHKQAENKVVTDDKGFVYSSEHLFMDGAGVFNFTLETVPPLINNTLDKNNKSLDDIDLFVLHQANKFMLDTIRKVSGISKDKFYINMEDKGNTVSSTVPIALKDALDSNLIYKNKTVFIAGFGVGLSWGACVLQF